MLTVAPFREFLREQEADIAASPTAPDRLAPIPEIPSARRSPVLAALPSRLTIPGLRCHPLLRPRAAEFHDDSVTADEDTTAAGWTIRARGRCRKLHVLPFATDVLAHGVKPPPFHAHGDIS